MKLLTKSIAISTLILAIAGPASAMVSPNLAHDVRSAAGANSNVHVTIDGDTVTLTGYAEDSYAVAQAVSAAEGDGVAKVVNHLFRSN